MVTERFAGWAFDMLLLTIPAGLLAFRGLERTASRWPRVAAAALVLALTPAVIPTLARVSGGVGAPPPTTPPPITPATAARPVHNSVYVFGDPRHLALAGMPMATTVHGWAWHVQPPEMWARVERELRAAPPVAIRVGPGYAKLIGERRPSLWTWLNRRYGAPHPESRWRPLAARR